MKDLIVLVADENMRATIKTLLEERYQSLNIRKICADIFVHPGRDPGVFKRAHEFLMGFCGSYRYALVMFDYEGCGQEHYPPVRVREDLLRRLQSSGWQRRCEVIVLVPELEAWVWSKSPHVSKVLGLERQQMQSIVNQFDPDPKTGKPKKPKEAMEKCLRSSKIPRSSSLYAELARKVSLKHCSDPAFLQFRGVLQLWFGHQPVKNCHP
jgi:hypothetical protein